MRVRLERVLRGVVIAVLAMMLWQSLHEQSVFGRQSMSSRGVGGALVKWSALAKAPTAIHVQLDSMPSRVERAWLGALAGAGSRVAWSGDLPAVMIDAQPIASPVGGTKVLVAAPSGSSVVVRDDVGVIDTVRAQNAGAALSLASIAGNVTAHAKGSFASTVSRDSVVLRKVLVIGSAGWESKFVTAALEEEGWKVDAFVRVAPGVDVTQGPVAAIDTARYSAVVALDGAAATYANRIIEFVRTGGGVVLAPQAAALDALGPLRAGTVGRASSDARAIQSGGSVTLATLALGPINPLRSDAILLGQRAGAVSIAARRIGAGRSLQLGYDDTWRWRMGGSDGAVRDHRLWWTGLVSSVAYAPRVPRSATITLTDQAPLAGLVGAIGSNVLTVRTSSLAGATSGWTPWLFVLLALALVGEVLSRRARGLG
jgi:hypothetical protein